MVSLESRVCQLARQAGEQIMRFYRSGAEVTLKEDSLPLTAADQASHDFLVESLKPLIPGVQVISEESEKTEIGSNGSKRSHWLVDPLDGTKEFVKGTNEFTVILLWWKVAGR